MATIRAFVRFLGLDKHGVIQTCPLTSGFVWCYTAHMVEPVSKTVQKFEFLPLFLSTFGSLVGIIADPVGTLANMTLR